MFSLIASIVDLFKTSSTNNTKVNRDIIQQRDNNLADELVVIFVFLPWVLTMFGIDVWANMSKIPEFYQIMMMTVVIGVVGSAKAGNLREIFKK